MAKRKTDWDSLHKEWRTGQLSNVLLGKKYNISEGAIRKKSKLKGWKKDLVDQYQKGVEEELVRESTKESSSLAPIKSEAETKEDRQIVKEAVGIAVDVVKRHRKDVKRLSRIKDTLTGKLEDAIKEEPDTNGNLPSLIGFQSYHESMFDVLSKLSGITSNLIKVERQAFNIDAKEKGSDKPGAVDVEERIREHMRRNGIDG